ncbi:MAG: N-acetylmuramoyl-L-alanine amidase [Dehalococcoidia bacterium]
MDETSQRQFFPYGRCAFAAAVVAGIGLLVAAWVAATGSASVASAASTDYLVCLDPGHTLDGDVGAVSTATIRRHTITLREVDLNLDTAHAVRRELEAQGVSVVMTWDGAHVGWPETGAPDEPPPPTFSSDPGPNDPAGLEARGRACVDAGADVMFAIHYNGLPGPGNGLVTLFRDPGSGQRDRDRAVAQVVHDTMWDLLSPGKASREFTDFGLFFNDWGIARGAMGIPAVILEPVVITNETEAQRLVPTIGQGGLRRLQIVAAEVAAILAARPVVEQITESKR